MIKLEQIPDEVVEAAARAAYERWCETIRKRETDTAGIELVDDLCPPWDDLGDEGKADWLDQARAAIAAGLGAWPGMLKRPVGSYYAIVIAAHLVLPLPDEGAPTRGDACND